MYFKQGFLYFYLLMNTLSSAIQQGSAIFLREARQHSKTVHKKNHTVMANSDYSAIHIVA